LIVSKQGSFTFKTPLAYPLMIFFLWSLLSIFWSLNMENSISDVRKHLLNHIILYFLLINAFHSKWRLSVLAWIVVLSTTAFSVTGIVYYYIISGASIDSVRFGHILNSVNVSTELPVNFIGTLTVCAVILCLHLYFQERVVYRRVLTMACLIPVGLATLLTQSRGTFLALVVSLTLLLFIKAKKSALLLLLAVILLIVMTTPLQDKLGRELRSFKERLYINCVTCDVIKDHPLLGIGFGMQTFIYDIGKESYVKKVSKGYRPAAILTPHNWLLDITVRLGLIGLLLFLYILFVFGRMCWETIRHPRDRYIRDWGLSTAAAFVGYFIIGMAEPVFLFRASATVFFIILALITILWHLNQEMQGDCSQPCEAYC
jgi:O-antigen ligase